MSKHIVGRKTDSYLTAVKPNYGRPWIVTKHTVVNELHATKGWRTVQHRREQQTRSKLPSMKRSNRSIAAL